MTAQEERTMSIPKQDERTPDAYLIEAPQGNWLQFTPEVAEADKPLVRVKPLYAYTSTEALRSALAEGRQAAVELASLMREGAHDKEEIKWCKVVDKIDAALSGSPAPSTRSLGYLYFNPDTGTEFSENHPVESGECDDAENVREATAEALRDELLEAWREREDAEVELARKMEPVKMSTLTEAQIKHMVDRFLMWKLPEHFCPDDGISFDPIASKGTPHEYRRTPVGTNLFCADQATEMVRHMLEGLPGASPAPSTEGLREALAKLVTTARLLWQNAAGCAVNHHGHDFQKLGSPDWLANCENDIVAARTALAGVTAPTTEPLSDDDCEDQGLAATDVCLRSECQSIQDNDRVRPKLVKRGDFWCCPRCGHSYGAHAKGCPISRCDGSFGGGWEMSDRAELIEACRKWWADLCPLGDPEGISENSAVQRLAAFVEEHRVQTWQPISSAPKDGTHIIGLTRFGACEVWWKRDTYDGEFWQDENDSEPDPSHWVPKPRKSVSPTPSGVTAPSEVDAK